MATFFQILPNLSFTTISYHSMQHVQSKNVTKQFKSKCWLSLYKKICLPTTRLFIRIFIVEQTQCLVQLTLFLIITDPTQISVLLTNDLWSRFHMEKIIFPLLNKKFATSYGNQNPTAKISNSTRTHLGNMPHPPDHSWAHWSLEDRYTCNPAALWLPGRHPGSSMGSLHKSHKLWRHDSGWHHVPDHDGLIQ
jgi:hypothetical protein